MGQDMDMSANALPTLEATHPGELIREELEARQMTQAELARRIGVAPSLLCEMINGKRDVSTEYALLLEAVWGISADMWLNLQTEYNKQRARRNSALSRRLAEIRRVAAIL